MAINTGDIGLALWPGQKAWWGVSYNLYPEEFKVIFDTYPSDKNSEETTSFVQLGLMSVKPEGSAVNYGNMRQGFRNRVIHVTYGLGYTISWNNEECGIAKARLTLARWYVLPKKLLQLIFNRPLTPRHTYADEGWLQTIGCFRHLSNDVCGDFSQVAIEQAG